MIHPGNLSWKRRGTWNGRLSAVSVGGGDVMCQSVVHEELQSEKLHLCESAACVTL